MKNVKIKTEFIKLDQLLKYIGIAETGGHSKEMIKNGEIKVNGEIAYERGKKIRNGDIVEILGEDSFIIEREL